VPLCHCYLADLDFYSCARLANIDTRHLQVGSIPASLVAMFYAGWFGDKVNIWLAARNNGIHRPEHNLIHLVVPYFAGTVGIILFGIGANNPSRYPAALLLVGGCSSLCRQSLLESQFLT